MPWPDCKYVLEFLNFGESSAEYGIVNLGCETSFKITTLYSQIRKLKLFEYWRSRILAC